jgi:hypothetical protein
MNRAERLLTRALAAVRRAGVTAATPAAAPSGTER